MLSNHPNIIGRSVGGGGGGGSGAVDSVFGRTGDVTADVSDYSTYYGQLAAANQWTGVNTFDGSFIFTPATITIAANAGTIDITKSRSVATVSANVTLTPNGAGTSGQQIGIAVVNNDTASHTVAGAGSASTISYTIAASSTTLTYWQSNGSAWAVVGGAPTVHDLSTATPVSTDEVQFWDVSAGTMAKTTVSGLFTASGVSGYPTPAVMNGVAFPATSSFFVRDDFIQGASTGLWNTANTNGTGALSTFGTGDGTHPGVWSLADGTSGAGTAGLRSAGTQILFNGLTWEFFARVKSGSAISDGTNTYSFLIGFTDSTTGLPTDGAFFYHDNAGGSNWQAFTRSNGTPTTASGGAGSVAVVADTWYDLRISVNSAGTSVTFYVYSAGSWLSIGSCASNIPTSAGRETGLGAYIISTAGSLSRTWLIDAIVCYAS